MNAAMCGQIGAVKNKLSNNVHAPRFFFFFLFLSEKLRCVGFNTNSYVNESQMSQST